MSRSKEECEDEFDDRRRDCRWCFLLSLLGDGDLLRRVAWRSSGLLPLLGVDDLDFDLRFDSFPSFVISRLAPEAAATAVELVCKGMGSEDSDEAASLLTDLPLEDEGDLLFLLRFLGISEELLLPELDEELLPREEDEWEEDTSFEAFLPLVDFFS